MTNLSDTSLAAFRQVDLTGGQRRVLALFHAKPWGFAATRQEIADQTNMLLQSACGRVHELLEAGILEELPARNGAHPVRLTQANTTRGLPAKTAHAGGRNARPVAVHEAGTEGRRGDSKVEKIVAVKPYLGRLSETVENARAILSHPRVELIAADLVAECREVLRRGERFRVAGS